MKLLDAITKFENAFTWTSGPTRNNEVARVWCSAGRIGRHTVRLYYYRGLKKALTQDALLAVMIVSNSKSVYKYEIVPMDNDMKNVAASVKKIDDAISKVKSFFNGLPVKRAVRPVKTKSKAKK